MGNTTFNPKEFQSKIEKGYAGDVNPKEAWDILSKDNSSVLVDVRTSPEWILTGCPDLSSLNKQTVYVSWRKYPDMEINENFAQDVLAQKSIEKDSPIFFLCKVGGRSIDAAIEMTKQGFTQCYNVAEGFEGELDANGHRGAKDGWKKHNLPWEQR